MFIHQCLAICSNMYIKRTLHYKITNYLYLRDKQQGGMENFNSKVRKVRLYREPCSTQPQFLAGNLRDSTVVGGQRRGKFGKFSHSGRMTKARGRELVV